MVRVKEEGWQAEWQVRLKEATEAGLFTCVSSSESSEDRADFPSMPRMSSYTHEAAWCS